MQMRLQVVLERIQHSCFLILRLDVLLQCIVIAVLVLPFHTHLKILAEWERACKFLNGSGSNYGLLGASPSDLDDAGKELLQEVFTLTYFFVR